MKIKHNDIDIPQGDPFANCKLGMKKYAEVLTDIVASYADGFVMTINNEWGTGKTTFVKMWQRYLENREYRTLYFNAWENDFEGDALVALISELEKLKGTKNKLFEKVKENAAPLAKKLGLAIAKGLVSKYVGSEVVKEVVELTTDEAASLLGDEIESYQKRKKSAVGFKKSLAKFIAETNDDKPVVFIIDELDRCRPNYAVQVLEQIKHLFSVTGIVFVLSIDKIQLGHAVKGVYGSDRIDSDEYLRRFIDLEYSLPKSSISTKMYFDYLYDYFEFDTFFHDEVRSSFEVFKVERETFFNITLMLFDDANLTLRQQEKMFAHARIVLKLFKNNSYLLPSLFMYLIFIKSYHNGYFRRIEYGQLSLEELLERFKETIPTSLLTTEHRHSLAYLEALLLHTYNNFFNHNSGFQLVNRKPDESDKTVVIRSKINIKGYQKTFIDKLIYFHDHMDLDRFSITLLVRKINLLDPIVL